MIFDLMYADYIDFRTKMALIEEYGSLAAVKEHYTNESDDRVWLGHPWGSCQYSSAWTMFETLRQLNLTDQGLEQQLGIQLQYGSPREDWLELAKERLRQHYEDWPDENEEERNGRNQQITALQNGDQILDFCRSWAWDLWGAAPFLAECIYPNLDIVVEQSVGHGPILNQMVQSGNNQTGIFCYLLYRDRYVSSIEAFGGFDT